MTGNHGNINDPNVEYTVTIKKTLKNVPFKDKEYEITGKDENGESKGGYVYFDSTRNETSDIFEQVVTDLDVQAVIKSVNGI
jgi:L-lactate utilization protein LutB